MVCSTGLSMEEIIVSKSIVSQLGMRWDDDLHDGVTHLLAVVVGSDKYKAAKAAKMKVVKLDWLKECFRAAKVVPADQYELGPLEGLCICTTEYKDEDAYRLLEDHLHPSETSFHGDDGIDDVGATCLKLNDQLQQCLTMLDGEPAGAACICDTTNHLALKTHIKGVGGRYRELNTTDPRILQPTDVLRITHIVLGHGCDLPDGMLPSLVASMPRAKLVTELSMRACISMFVDVERAVMACLVRLTGAVLTTKLSKRNTHLVCRTPQGNWPKYTKAVEWNVRIVDANWLIASVSASAFAAYPTDAKKRKLDAIEGGHVEVAHERPQQPMDPLRQDDADVGGAQTQLENLLGDMGGDAESCSLDTRYHVVPSVDAPSDKATTTASRLFFEDSQAPAPHSEMVQYQDD
ncbi:hypothetical protein DYB37_000785 [Aphanomyces astaci]|uniref:BRCT domain-containing protein n=1 Tax=Aphanomyces astaci TaxID=112090 RepID=A0A3R7B3P1_APHAT|nr:hypothetical protein DYB35_000558 [Aphanomyces astaci]RHZ26790.1 hypothetical protein DYB37_000785 [Aphanomyces astaci]